MDPRRFEDLARDLGSGPASRRRVLRGAIAGGAAAFGVDRGRFAAPSAAAAPTDGVCQDGPITGKHTCDATPCGAVEGCYCIQTIGHVRRCLTGFNPNLGEKHCPSKNQCGDGQPCPAGSYYAKVEGCCGRNYHKCLRACPR